MGLERVDDSAPAASGPAQGGPREGFRRLAASGWRPLTTPAGFVSWRKTQVPRTATTPLRTANAEPTSTSCGGGRNKKMHRRHEFGFTLNYDDLTLSLGCFLVRARHGMINVDLADYILFH